MDPLKNLSPFETGKIQAAVTQTQQYILKDVLSKHKQRGVPGQRNKGTNVCYIKLYLYNLEQDLYRTGYL